MSEASTVIKNTSVLSFGQAATLLFGVLFTALLSRHIGPEGYGQYAYAQSAVAILMVFVGLGFSDLAVRNVAQRRGEASKYFTNIVVMKVALAVIVFSLFLGIGAFKNSSREIIALVLLFGVSMTLESLTQVAADIFYAYERMEYDAALKIVRALMALGLLAGAVLLGFGLAQIVAILIVANLVRVVLGFGLLSSKVTRIKFEIDPTFCRKILVAGLPFAMLVFVNVAFANVSIVMLGYMKDSTEVGWYASAIRVLNMLLILPGMLLISLYPAFSRTFASKKDSLAKPYSKAYEWGLILGVPMAVGVFLTAESVIDLLFGPGFENAANVLRLLSVVVAVGFCNNVNGAAVVAMGREKLFAAISIVTVTIVVALNWLLIPALSYLGPPITYGIATGLGFVIYSYLCHRWLRLRIPWRKAMKPILAALGMAICVIVALEVDLNFLIVVFGVGPISYVGLLYLLRGFSSEDILLIKRAIRLPSRAGLRLP